MSAARIPFSFRRAPRWMGMAALVCLAACGTNTPPPGPAAFSRPSDVTFACLRVGADSVSALPLSDCDVTTDEDSEVRLHALVTQTSTGEVAAVDLAASKILDDRPDIPGYTFVDVGALPTAVAVPEVSSEFTYVGNGEGQIGVFRTAAFHPLPGWAIEPRVQDPPVQLPGLSRPADIVVAPDESALFVASPSTGELFIVPICRDSAACELGHLLAPMAVDIAVPDAIAGPTRGPEGEPYVSFGECEEQYTFVPSPDPTWPADGGVADGDAGMAESDAGTTAQASARPVSLVIDSACDGNEGCLPRLLVADDSLPVIHRFEIDGTQLTPITPWFPGVPTSALAPTPDVPTEVLGDQLTHYVYGIDHEDGSVFVLQDGALLPVNDAFGQRVDRLPLAGASFGARALSLSVMTPAPELGGGQCLLGEPTSLGGVFLSVGLSDGTLLVYDIDDADLIRATVSDTTVTAPSGFCRECPFAIKRHRQRGASFFGDFERSLAQLSADPPLPPTLVAPTLAGLPSYQLDDRNFDVNAKGTSSDGRLPTLACLTCPEGMVRAFPGRPRPSADSVEVMDVDGVDVDVDTGCPVGEARLCVDASPFRKTGEVWLSVFEGDLPESGGIGSFAADGTFQVSSAAGTNLCEGGVLGEDELGGAGDKLVLLPVPKTLLDGVTDRTCRNLISRLSEGKRAVALPIRSAFADRVVFDDGNNITDALVDLEQRNSLAVPVDQVVSCFSGLGTRDNPAVLSFIVAVRDTFVARGTSTVFEHRVRQAEDGHCEADPTAPEFMERRIPVSSDGDLVYNNGRVAFALRGTVGNIPKNEGLYLQFTVEAANPALVFDTVFRSTSSGVNSVLPQVMRYGVMDRRLYVVDPHSRGLFSIDVDEFVTNSSLFKQFN